MIQGLIDLAGGLAALDGIKQRARGRARQLALQIAVCVIGAVAVLTGLGFLLAALWVWLAPMYGALVANLLIGGGLALAGAGIALSAGSIGSGETPAAPAQPLAGFDTAAIGKMADDVEALLQRDGNSFKAMAVAVIAGFLTGRGLGR